MPFANPHANIIPGNKQFVGPDKDCGPEEILRLISGTSDRSDDKIPGTQPGKQSGIGLKPRSSIFSGRTFNPVARIA
jgi:hypothetical protein